MKTVLQDLIEGFNVTPDETFCEWLREQQNNLLEKEKKQIIDAHEQGREDFLQEISRNAMYGKGYYNETYNQNK